MKTRSGAPLEATATRILALAVELDAMMLQASIDGLRVEVLLREYRVSTRHPAGLTKMIVKVWQGIGNEPGGIIG